MVGQISLGVSGPGQDLLQLLALGRGHQLPGGRRDGQLQPGQQLQRGVAGMLQ